MLEFPEDWTAVTVETRYPLADSLLVSQLFRADGEVDGYLPEGTWTHLLSGERREGRTGTGSSTASMRYRCMCASARSWPVARSPTGPTTTTWPG